MFHWALYDWANSAYATTVVAAILPAYFTGAVVPEGFEIAGHHLEGDALWGFLTGGWALLLFVMSPILGAIADFSASKHRFLTGFFILGGTMAVGIGLAPPSQPVTIMILFVLAQVGFLSANVFYDGFLPEIARKRSMDRISAIGYAAGYAGGGIQLALSLALVTQADRLGLEGTTAARIALGTAGLWWLGFGAWSLLGLKDAGEPGSVAAELRFPRRLAVYTRIGVVRTWATLKRLRGFPQLLLFLLAYLVYNDGVQTMNNMASAYATGTLELGLDTILTAFLLSQLSAFPGALGFGWLAGRVGAKRAVLGSLVIWSLVATLAFNLAVGAAQAFIGIAITAGFAQGGNQALSRSLFGSMIPERAAAEFYGFYSVTAKFSAIWGPLIYAVIRDTTGSARYAILSLLFFFVIGGLLLARVDVDEARKSRARWDLDAVTPG